MHVFVLSCIIQVGKGGDSLHTTTTTKTSNFTKWSKFNMNLHITHYIW